MEISNNWRILQCLILRDLLCFEEEGLTRESEASQKETKERVRNSGVE